MIYIRNPKVDDLIILQLIEQELLPIARKTFPDLKLDQKGLIERLNQGRTYVIRNRLLKTIGFVHAFIKKQSIWIDMLALDRKYRNKGLGQRLLQRAEQYAKFKLCTESHLYVDQLNIKAQIFYQKHDYEPIRYVQHLHCYLYTKSIV